MSAKKVRTITRCEYVTEHPAGPHPGCAEFDGGATFEVQCPEGATRLFLVNDEMAEAVGENPTQAWLFCDEHAAALRGDVSNPYVTILSEQPVPQDAQ